MAANLRRLFQLWGLYGRMDILYVARGPKLALTYYLSDLILGLSAVTAIFLLAERFNGIGVWSRDQVIFMLGFALLVRGTINILFEYNVAFISRKIGRGQLDHMLLQPQPLWMGLLTEGFAPLTGAGQWVPALLVLWWACAQLQVQVSASWLALMALYLACSVSIMLAFNYAWGSLAFWAPRAAEEINSTTWRLLVQLNVFPLDGLPVVALTGLLTFVPAGFVAWYPSRVLLGLAIGPWDWLVPLLAALLFVGLGAGIFARGLDHYGRTGSSRYLSWGHRS